MDESKQIKKVAVYPVERIVENSNLLTRGLEELGLLTTILKLLSNGETLKIKALDGLRTIKTSGDMFRDIINDFPGYSDNELSHDKTNETEVLIYEATNEINPYQMFASLNKDFNAMCFTQDQILEFIDKYKEYKLLDNKHVIYFLLFKAGGRVFCSTIFLNIWNNDFSSLIWHPIWSDQDIATLSKEHEGYSERGSYRVVIPKRSNMSEEG